METSFTSLYEFRGNNGVKQGDNLSPTLFYGFINDLINKLNSLNVGVRVNDTKKVCVLAYADDIVLLSKSVPELELMLATLSDWCKMWRVLLNVQKTKIVHFRKRGVKRCNVNFRVGTETLDFVESYKYRGVTLGCNLDIDTTVDSLSIAGSRALGSIISKTKSNYDLGYNSYMKLFESSVVPILDYGSGVWSLGTKVAKIDGVQNRAIRYYCGLARGTPLIVLNGEMGWCPSIIRHDVETVRLYNQIVKMDDNRLTRMLFKYEKENVGLWYKNLRDICEASNCLSELESESSVKYCQIKK